MSQVVISVGSNIRPRSNIPRGLKALSRAVGGLAVSPCYESRAVGFEGANFLNLVVAMETVESLGAISARLAAIEAAAGRTPAQRGFAARSLDLDIILFGTFTGTWRGRLLPRADLLDYAFVLKPLADLLPLQRHPIRGRTFATLWRDFPHKAEQPMWPSPLQWGPRGGTEPQPVKHALYSTAGSAKSRLS